MSACPLPLEIWIQILQYCSTNCLLTLALVSPDFRDEVRKRLYRKLFSSETHSSWKAGSATLIRDLNLFYRSLRTDFGWQCLVQEVNLHWSNGARNAWGEIGPSSEDEDERHHHLDELVKNTACLLSEAPTLQTLHLHIPQLDSTVPFFIPRLDSLTIPVTGCINNDPDFGRLLALFQIPSLRYVELDSMLRLNCTVPADYCKSKTSNVTHLRFKDCGPISKEISDLLSWPRDLQKLDFSVAIASGLNRYAYDYGDFSMIGILDALWVLRDSIQDLTISISEWVGMPDDPLEEKAFQSFEKLRRLHIPLELLFHFEEDLEEDGLPLGFYTTPTLPLHPRLPSSLQELMIDVERDLPWYEEIEKDTDPLVPSKQAGELLTWLSDLARHKSRCFPGLYKVRVIRNVQIYSVVTEDEYARYYPVKCQQTRDFMELMQSRDIDMVFV